MTRLGALILVLLSISSLSTNAQCIADQSIKDPGFYPDVLEAAWVDWKYEQTLQFRIIEDTTVVFQGFPAVVFVDSANLLEIINLPEVFTYECGRKNCSFIPDSTGCAILSGEPTISDTGTYQLGLVVQLFGKVFGTYAVDQTDTLEIFTLEVKEGSASIKTLSNPTYSVYPNPNSGRVFEYNAPNNTTIECYAADGSHTTVLQNENTFELPHASKGLYFLQFTAESGVSILKKIFITE